MSSIEEKEWLSARDDNWAHLHCDSENVLPAVTILVRLRRIGTKMDSAVFWCIKHDQCLVSLSLPCGDLFLSSNNPLTVCPGLQLLMVVVGPRLASAGYLLPLPQISAPWLTRASLPS